MREGAQVRKATDRGKGEHEHLIGAGEQNQSSVGQQKKWTQATSEVGRGWRTP